SATRRAPTPGSNRPSSANSTFQFGPMKGHQLSKGAHMASQHFGRVVDASRTGEWTRENRANTGNGRIGRVGHQDSTASSLLDEISSHWSQFIVSTTPHAAEILTLTAAASYLLHIP